MIDSSGRALISRTEEEEYHAVNVLLRLCRVFDAYHAGNYDQALSALDVLQLWPQSTLALHDHHQLETALIAFKSLHDSVRRNYAEVAVVCMEILFAKYQSVKADLEDTYGNTNNNSSSSSSSSSSSAGRDERDVRGIGMRLGNYPDTSRRQLLQSLRDRAKALGNFIGLNQLYIGADVNAKLVRLEARMT
jgi:hypothetical protein